MSQLTPSSDSRQPLGPWQGVGISFPSSHTSCVVLSWHFESPLLHELPAAFLQPASKSIEKSRGTKRRFIDSMNRSWRSLSGCRVYSICLGHEAARLLQRSERAAHAATLCAALTFAQQVAGKAARDALFLSAFDVSALPAMLVVSALASIALALASTRWMTR